VASSAGDRAGSAADPVLSAAIGQQLAKFCVDSSKTDFGWHWVDAATLHKNAGIYGAPGGSAGVVGWVEACARQGTSAFFVASCRAAPLPRIPNDNNDTAQLLLKRVAAVVGAEHQPALRT
jgi:hypothetical protein